MQLRLFFISFFSSNFSCFFHFSFNFFVYPCLFSFAFLFLLLFYSFVNCFCFSTMHITRMILISHLSISLIIENTRDRRQCTKTDVTFGTFQCTYIHIYKDIRYPRVTCTNQFTRVSIYCLSYERRFFHNSQLYAKYCSRIYRVMAIITQEIWSNFQSPLQLSSLFSSGYNFFREISVLHWISSFYHSDPLSLLK